MRITPPLRVIELEISRFPHKERPYMPGSKTTQGRSNTRAGVSDRVAFRVSYLVGALREITYAARWLAYTLPCRRFACILADTDARLGVNVDRYSFTATDLHRPLLAGLPAHNLLIFMVAREEHEPSTSALWAQASRKSS
jgi:hypothetical protein